MNFARYMPRNTLALMSVAMAGLLSGNASALTLANLKDAHLDDIYGTYGPGGDCKREPRISVDDSGLAYAYAGKTTHSKSIEYAVSYGPPGYVGISRWIFPFPVSEDDFGRVLMTFNANEKPGALSLEPDLGPGQRLSALQAALVKAARYAKCKPPQR
ncbi:MAG: hypothetical protein ABIP11_09430 [Luteimonas sp.]